MDGSLLGGILGWEVCENPCSGKFSSAWLKSLILSQKETFCVPWDKPWEHFLPKVGHTRPKNPAGAQEFHQGRAEKEAFHCPGCYFPFLPENSTENKPLERGTETLRL